MKGCLGPELLEDGGLELPLVISMEAAHLGSSERFAVFASGYANECVELSYGSFGRVDHFGFALEDFNHDESGMLVDEEGGVSIATEERETFFISFRSACRSPGSGGGT